MIINKSSEVFEDNDERLIPCIVQDSINKTVLMLGYMNSESLNKTLSGNQVTFYSRSRKTLWTKGETSGHYLEWTEIRKDCDGDTLLIKARPQGPVCHTGQSTCFNESNSKRTLDKLEEIIQDRKSNPSSDSYTTKLLNQGIKRVAQKVGEEAVELVIEAGSVDREKFLGEAADLTYHLIVLLAAKNLTLADVEQMLLSRMK